MTEEQKFRLEELREKQVRSYQKETLIDRLKDKLPPDSYKILDTEMKDYIQEGTAEWPKDKWDKKLYIQALSSNPARITKVVSRFLKQNSSDYSYVFLSGYFSLILQVSNDFLLHQWISLIDVDGDDITCYIPGRKDYICIELIEEKLAGQEDLGFCWLYELTFSSEKIKAELVKDGA